MVQVGIIGASGYTGAELLRLCAGHPDLEVRVATGDTQAGTRAADLYPSLAAAYPDLVFTAYDPADRGRPRPGVPRPAPRRQPGASCPSCSARSATWSTWRPTSGCRTPASTRSGTARPTRRPELLPDFAYGLPELFRDEIAAAAHVATPGLLPDGGRAGAGAAGAGRAWSRRPGSSSTPRPGCRGPAGRPKPNTTFCTVDEDFTAYGLLDHRHTPEMEQVLGRLGAVHAAPGADEPGDPGHLLRPPHRRRPPPTRCSTCSGPPTPTSRSWSCTDGSPSTKATLGSNCAHVTARYDERTGYGRGHRRHRQPHQGGLRARPCSAPTSSSASPRPPASPSPGCTRDPLLFWRRIWAPSARR